MCRHIDGNQLGQGQSCTPIRATAPSQGARPIPIRAPDSSEREQVIQAPRTGREPFSRPSRGCMCRSTLGRGTQLGATVVGETSTWGDARELEGGAGQVQGKAEDEETNLNPELR